VPGLLIGLREIKDGRQKGKGGGEKRGDHYSFLLLLKGTVGREEKKREGGTLQLLFHMEKEGGRRVRELIFIPFIQERKKGRGKKKAEGRGNRVVRFFNLQTVGQRGKKGKREGGGPPFGYL